MTRLEEAKEEEEKGEENEEEEDLGGQVGALVDGDNEGGLLEAVLDGEEESAELAGRLVLLVVLDQGVGVQGGLLLRVRALGQ